MAKRKKKKSIVPAIVAVVLVIAVLVVFVPRLVHKCDSCGKTFVGTGFRGNVISEALSDNERILCRECAEKEHLLSGIVGKSVDDYKRPLFGSSKNGGN